VKALLLNTGSALAVVAAAYLASLGISGWGWFLLVAVLLSYNFEEKE
jgi:hypothetical protein